MTTPEFKQGFVIHNDDSGMGEPYSQYLDLWVKPPFTPGEGLSRVVDLMGCSVELVGANEKVSHLRLQRTDALHVNNMRGLNSGVDNLKSYILNLSQLAK